MPTDNSTYHFFSSIQVRSYHVYLKTAAIYACPTAPILWYIIDLNAPEIDMGWVNPCELGWVWVRIFHFVMDWVGSS